MAKAEASVEELVSMMERKNVLRLTLFSPWP